MLKVSKEFQVPLGEILNVEGNLPGTYNSTDVLAQ
jgi:hypothetical protein